MKTKLVLSTNRKDLEYWFELPFTPRINEWFNVTDILKSEEIESIKNAANCWSGIRGVAQSVEYRHDGTDFYVEVYIWCED